jgi:allophanate hydrolase subunit 1
LKLFDMDRMPPTLLMPGDRIKFVSISQEEFDQIAATQRQGTTS